MCFAYLAWLLPYPLEYSGPASRAQWAASRHGECTTSPSLRFSSCMCVLSVCSCSVLVLMRAFNSACSGSFTVTGRDCQFFVSLRLFRANPQATQRGPTLGAQQGA